METGLLRDRDWAPLDGELCRVTSLVTLGFSRRMPYGSVEVESPRLTEPVTGFVCHKLDFANLSEAFSRRDQEPNTEVLISWTKRHHMWWAKPFGSFMPRMWVMLCRENAYELITDRTYKPELDGLERVRAQDPIASWKPPSMQ
jgi:hypothetical protein